MRRLALLLCGLLACEGSAPLPDGGTGGSGGVGGTGGSGGVGGTGGSGGVGGSGGGGVGGSGGTGGVGGSGGGGGVGGSGGTADAGVDPQTLQGKLIFGYQGWFACPGDGSQPNRWVHWFRGDGSPTFDMWPDVRELGAGEKCATALALPDGGAAAVFSAFRAPTVSRHFAWMKQHGIDGVMLQRFTSELGDPAFKSLRDQVLQNVRAAAEAQGRVFAVMYDISGQNPSTLVTTLQSDWAYLVNTLQVTQSPRYLKHGGRPVLAIWGLGFSDRPGTTAEAAQLIAWFKSGAPVGERVTLMGGVPRDWRSDATWAPVIRQFDVVSPWTVGAFVDDPGADTYKTRLAGDLADGADAGFAFMPVIFPGFSWKNLNNGPLNQIPRRGGRFWWRQLYNAKSVGASMVYGAMFDEVDEGTAMFKTVERAADQPSAYPFLPLDADGEALGSDWYLRLAGAGAKMLRGEIPLTSVRPNNP